jgi:cbb3-type cytochrome oxidase maturation protein
MEALFLLIPLSVLGIGFAVWVFFRMSDSGQFDDLDSPAHGILLDDDRPAPPAAGAGDTEGSRAEPTPGTPPVRRDATTPPEG